MYVFGESLRVKAPYLISPAGGMKLRPSKYYFAVHVTSATFPTGVMK